MLSWLGMRMLKRRVVKERRRSQHETSTVAAIHKKVELNSKFILANDFENNMILLDSYMQSISAALEKRRNLETSDEGSTSLLKAFLFSNIKQGVESETFWPLASDTPDMKSAWTNQSKAMCVLRERCRFVVAQRCVERFRKSSPPIYDCAGCGQVLYLANEARSHRQRCVHFAEFKATGHRPEPKYECWQLAKPLADIILAPALRFLENV